jgi:hypothetical protein
MPKLDIFSPDGISIREKPFKTKKEAAEYYQEWVKRFENQGYYSSNRGKIELKHLSCNCTFGKGYGVTFRPICRLDEFLELQKLP